MIALARAAEIPQAGANRVWLRPKCSRAYSQIITDSAAAEGALMRGGGK